MIGDNYILFHAPDPRKKLILALIIFIAFFLWAVLAHADIVSIAQSQIGLGEIGGNNQGKHIRQYLNGQENLPWCAGFVSYCIRKAGIKTVYTLRARDYLKLGQRVSNPKPGDLIIFSRKGGGHIGIIEKVIKDKIITIEGNVGKYPAVVKRIIYNRNKIPNLLGFVTLTERQ